MFKKLVFVIPYLHSGGSERVTAALANEISRLPDWEVHVVTYSEDKSKEYFLNDNIIRHTLPVLSGNRLKKIFSRISFLKNTVKKISPICVISLGAVYITGLLCLAMVGSNITLILSERNDPVKMPKDKYKRIIRLLAYGFSDGIVFQTHEAMNFFPKFIRKKGTVISNPLTADLPYPYYGIREKRIVNFCRFVPQKNLPLLIEAFELLAVDFPEHQLHLYGDGLERKMIEDLIKEKYLADRVVIHGYSKHVHEDIVKAALFVSSSDYEGISNSMLEAMALGIPSVCTDCPAGGAKETIIDGVNGLLVPVGDKYALSNAMKRILSDEKISLEMSRNSVKLREQLSVDKIAKQWLGFINKLL